MVAQQSHLGLTLHVHLLDAPDREPERLFKVCNTRTKERLWQVKTEKKRNEEIQHVQDDKKVSR